MIQSGSRAGVILADNDVLLRGIIRSVLVHAEQQVFVARDGNEAVALAQQFMVQLVLLDVKMPNLNGIQTCKAIRALPGYADIPIIMLTGFGDPKTRAAAKNAGATDFVTKPFQPDLLVKRVRAYLARSEQAQ